MSDLAEAMNTLLSLMQQYLGDHDTPLPVMVEAAGDEDDDEDDEDIDNLMPPLGEAEARLYQRIPDWRHGDDLIELEDEEGEDLDDGRSPGPLWFHGPGGRC